MTVEVVELQRTPEAYFRWVASTPDGEVRTRGPTPAAALHHLHARLSERTRTESTPVTMH